jgi:hypothetical protein
MWRIKINGSFIYKTSLKEAEKYIKEYVKPKGKSYELISPDNKVVEKG